MTNQYPVSSIQYPVSSIFSVGIGFIKLLLGILLRLKIFVPTCAAAEIVGFSVDDTFNPLFLGKVSLTKRILDHYVIDHRQSLLLWSPCGRLPWKYQLLEHQIAKINQEAKN